MYVENNEGVKGRQMRRLILWVRRGNSTRKLVEGL
jgi:hypothetical protein